MYENQRKALVQKHLFKKTFEFANIYLILKLLNKHKYLSVFCSSDFYANTTIMY